MPGQNQRIKWWVAIGLLLLAALIDFIQFLTTLVAIGAFLSPVISIAATFLFWIIFKLLNISFINNPKRLATFAIESIGELLPVIDALPLWTLGTLVTIIITRSEDSGGIIGQAANLGGNFNAKKNPKIGLPR